MRGLSKRLGDLEASAPSNTKEHWIYKEDNWDEQIVRDHYGRDRIGPNDKIIWVVFRRESDAEAAVYPAGYFDPDGRWAEVCAAHGVHYRDHARAA
jgi:hypothetical protein